MSAGREAMEGRGIRRRADLLVRRVPDSSAQRARMGRPGHRRRLRGVSGGLSHRRYGITTNGGRLPRSLNRLLCSAAGFVAVQRCSWQGHVQDRGTINNSDTGAAVAMKILDKATIVNHRMMHQAHGGLGQIQTAVTGAFYGDGRHEVGDTHIPKVTIRAHAHPHAALKQVVDARNWLASYVFCRGAINYCV